MADGEVPASAIARLRGRSGQVAGTAFLVTTDLVVTCAHVVAAAIGGGRPEAHLPVDPVTVEFPLLGDGSTAVSEAVVIGWRPSRPDGSGDTAVLRLRTPAPAGARPARLTLSDTRWGDEVRVFGFPADLREDYGVWIEGELRARQSAGWLQIESAPQRRAIGPGFSGSPVWSPAASGVVGMVVAAERGAHSTTGYLLPTRALVEAHPEIGAPDPGEGCPYRGLDPFLEEHAAVFRGREALTSRLVDLAGSRALLVLAGPSGSGKSSLAYAGLIPRLRQLGTLVAPIRTLPETRPAAVLASAVVPILEPDRSELSRHAEAQTLADRLAASSQDTLPWLAGRLCERAGGGLLIFVDQLEETTADEARVLVGILHDLVRAAPRRADGSPRLLAALTLRSGALDSIVTDETAEAVRAGVVFVPPMSRHQLRTAVTAADVDFEPGLVDRILDDAGAEPGQLPLVEFTLERLWAHRSVGMLTHKAYEELGGVSGALARYAEDFYNNKLVDAERAGVQRLLVQMARPEDDGGFQRRPVRLADLDSELRPVLDRLAASRLVVVGRAVDGAEIADLAHQALLQRWPRLRDWLAQDRDFRTWQEQLRLSLTRWEADNRDPGGLLRGAALATAVKWTVDRPGDITPLEQAYIRSSRAFEQRRVRILRSVVAVISVLGLVAAGLAVVAAQRSEEAQDRLRTAASRQLADDAVRFRGIDPAKALQLALAAWHHDDTPEAYGALFAQYAALQPMEKVFENLWQDDFNRIVTSQDGSVAVMVNGTGLPAVWTGLTGDHPQSVHLSTGGKSHVGGDFQVSPSGRFLAYANALGGTLLWNLERREPAVELAADKPAGDPRPLTVKSIAFSTDESRLMVRRGGYNDDRPSIDVWDVQSGGRVAATYPVPSDFYPYAAFFGPDPGTVVFSNYTTTSVYELGTGRLLRSYPRPKTDAHDLVAMNGAVIAECDNDRLRVLDVASGAERRSLSSPSCGSGFTLDSSTNYAVFAPGPGEGDSNAYIYLVDLRSGKLYRCAIPPVDLLDTLGPARKLAVFAGVDGAPTAFLANKNMLYRFRAAAPVTVRTGDDAITWRARTVTPNGEFAVTIQTSGRIDVTDVKTNQTIASVSAPPGPAGINFQGVWFTVTADSRRLLIVQEDTLGVYSVPDLAVEHRANLPVPPNLGPPVQTDGVSNRWASSVVDVSEDQAVVLHAGVLTRWDVKAGQQIGVAVPLRPDDIAGQRRSAELAFAPMVRPGHPDEVAVVQPSGAVEVWSLGRQRVVATVNLEAARTQNSVVFNTKGDRLAVLSVNGETVVWDVDHNQHSGQLIPTGQLSGLLGFTPDNKLITVDTIGASHGTKFWDGQSGKRLADLTVPADAGAWTLRGDVLAVFGPGLARSVKLDPVLWFRQLCAASNRAYTDDEKRVLRRYGAGSEPPCR